MKTLHQHKIIQIIKHYDMELNITRKYQLHSHMYYIYIGINSIELFIVSKPNLLN